VKEDKSFLTKKMGKKKIFLKEKKNSSTLKDSVDFKRLLFLLVNSFHVRPNRSAVLIQQLRAIVASNGPQLGSHSSLDQAPDTNLLSTLMTLSSNKTEHHTQGSEGQRIDTEAAAENAETRLLKVLHDLLDSSKT
jgi:hypothetical protein